jgi:predicted P-loop ATPase/GTPase
MDDGADMTSITWFSYETYFETISYGLIVTQQSYKYLRL